MSAPSGARSSGRALVIAHRGASSEAPENTLPAIVLAREQGADRIEVDVQRTRDGRLVLHHDDDLSRSAGDPRRIEDVTLEELERIPLVGLRAAGAGAATAPTLAAAIAAAAPVPLVVEVKPVARDADGIAGAVVTEIGRAGVPVETVVISFDDAVVAALLPRLGPDRVGMIRGRENGANGWRELLVAATHLVVVSRHIAPPDVVARLVDSGKTVYVYALDDAKSVKRYAAAGAHGIISNRPAVAKAALDESAPTG